MSRRRAAARRRSTSDPRRLGGTIAGPGGAHVRGSVVLSVDRAVLLDKVDVCTVDEPGLVAMLLSGRINKQTDRAEVLYLMGADGLAAIFAQLLALMGRAGIPELRQLVAEELARLDADGVGGPV